MQLDLDGRIERIEKALTAPASPWTEQEAAEARRDIAAIQERRRIVGGHVVAALVGMAGVVILLKIHGAGGYVLGLGLGLGLALCATLGDLVESQFKRDLGIKDMSTMLPGHGGLMDRLDGMLPAALLTWVVLNAVSAA